MAEQALRGTSFLHPCGSALLVLLSFAPACEAVHPLVQVSVTGDLQGYPATKIWAYLGTRKSDDSPETLRTVPGHFRVDLPALARGVLEITVEGRDAADCTLSRGKAQLGIEADQPYSLQVTVARLAQRECIALMTPPAPPPAEGTPSLLQCPPVAAGRTCLVMSTDDGSLPPSPHPCQYPIVGQCDPGGRPLCLFRWRADGEPCNDSVGVCMAHQCRCKDADRCGYDCKLQCPYNSYCMDGQNCVLTAPARSGRASPGRGAPAGSRRRG